MDLKQFEIKILPLKNNIYRLAKALLGNATNAEDAVQDIYLKLWTQRDQLDQVENVKAFCLKIARNHCLDQWRIENKTDFDILNDAHIATERSPYEQTEQKDLVNQVKQQIANLPELQRTVIHLRDVEGMEFEEIAAITGLSENAIKVNLSRARQRIRILFNNKE
ncbi:MAG: RNA polymerase sigma factor [Microbacter sp.]